MPAFNLNNVTNIVKTSLKSVGCKPAGYIRGKRQIWVSDTENDPMFAVEHIGNELQAWFPSNDIQMFFEQAKGGHGVGVIQAENIVIELAFGMVGNGVTSGMCIFVAYDEE